MTGDLDLPRLVQVCEAATPGPWSVHHGTTAIHVDTDADSTFSVCLMSTCQPDPMATARYIATFNPTTVLTLLRRLGEAEELFMKVSQLLDGWHSDQAWTADDESLRRAITAWRQNKAKGKPHDAE